jgi:DNA sulfur modification protein DndD
LNGRLDIITLKLFGSDIEEITSLENKRKEFNVFLENELKKEGRMIGCLDDKNKVLEQVKKDRENLVSQSEIHSLIAKRLSVAEECSRVVHDLHTALSNQTRDKLSRRVNDTFREIIRKPYWAEIDDEYTLQIYKDIEGHGRQLVVEKSTAESQITSLSFISSIVNLAKEQQNREGQFVKGGVFPIIMDSPFGALDPEYRALIARYIPALADQVILMASSSQWQGTVEAECAPRVGKEVSLIYYTPNLDKSRENYYIRESDDYEYTLIEEGYHG